ncbi:hypothetical protein BBBOND_0305490 [Babesia bigemina]|uniref:Uncharacterized protein n=1 Tax=Babesia bigemina TaxID=5866 RepID=A0A061D7G0_BABBI|nr:hypothetical protein BBBOND_0305490 [Babesia bigemina]CDR96646.1 hypothetical protein BBBOND_0305490 [Babesia bigemina]|eukprot:XP_012768832.1 hypothetical protein BBBOND_0305490 [Babesia bigemina]
MSRAPKAEQFEMSLVRLKSGAGSRADDYIEPEDVDAEMPDEVVEQKQDDSGAEEATEKPRPKVRITSKEWRNLNKVNYGFNKEELKQFIRDIKQFKPVHGLRLPML